MENPVQKVLPFWKLPAQNPCLNGRVRLRNPGILLAESSNQRRTRTPLKETLEFGSSSCPVDVTKFGVFSTTFGRQNIVFAVEPPSHLHTGDRIICAQYVLTTKNQ